MPSATISTNLPDYAPGSTALFTGSGFQAGEIVDLQVLHTDSVPNTGPGQVPWQAQADSTGNFTTRWFVTYDSIDSTLQVTATG